jgi:hypothetical protein
MLVERGAHSLDGSTLPLLSKLGVWLKLAWRPNLSLATPLLAFTAAGDLGVVDALAGAC